MTANVLRSATILAGVEGRIPTKEYEIAFTTIDKFRGGVITLGKFSGTSSWERHSDDEIVHIIDGDIILRIENKSVSMFTGDIIVIPTAKWHQIYSAEMSSILYITRGRTEHSKINVFCQDDPLSGRGERILGAFLWCWYWMFGRRL